MSSSNFGRQVKSIGRLRGASSWTRCDAFPVHIWTDSTDNKWAKIDITIADGRPETEQNARRVSSGYSKRRLGLNTRSPKSKQMKHFTRRPNVRMQVSSHASSGSFFFMNFFWARVIFVGFRVDTEKTRGLGVVHSFTLRIPPTGESCSEFRNSPKASSIDRWSKVLITAAISPRFSKQ